MRDRRKFLQRAMAACIPALPGSWWMPQAHAQASSPDGTVTLVLPFGPGSVTDLTVRLLADHLRATFNKPFIVSNRPGANGTIGANVVAKAPPNGATLLFTTNTTHSVIRSLMKEVPYDPQRDFAPVARVASIRSMLVVGPSMPVRSIEEFVDHARGKPGRVRYGYGNSSGQIGGETISRELGLKLVAVPYKSNPQAVTDLLGASIEAAVLDLATGLPQVQAGRLRPLAMLSAKRSALLPEVPTLDETVAPGFDVMAWAGVFAPAGTAAARVQTLAAAIRQFTERADVRDKLAHAGVEPDFAGPEEFSAFLKLEETKWTRLAAAAGVRPE